MFRKKTLLEWICEQAEEEKEPRGPYNIPFVDRTFPASRSSSIVA